MRVFFFLACVASAFATGPSMAHPVARPEHRPLAWNLLWDKERSQAIKDQLGPSFQGDGGRLDGDGQSPTGVITRDLFHIVSANVQALAPKVEEVALWDADLILLQETKLAPHAVKDAPGVARGHGWTLVHGLPCKPADKAGGNKKAARTKASVEANSGGVAAMLKKPRRPIMHQMDDEAAALHATARWLELKVPITKAKGTLTVICIYGIPGANSDPRNK